MENPILQTLNRHISNPAQQNNDPRLGQFMQLIAILKKSKDPMGMINSMASTNPQIRDALQAVNQNGGDAKKTFYTLTKRMGVDPSIILKMFN